MREGENTNEIVKECLKAMMESEGYIDSVH
jgi:hypothetical protein